MTGAANQWQDRLLDDDIVVVLRAVVEGEWRVPVSVSVAAARAAADEIERLRMERLGDAT